MTSDSAVLIPGNMGTESWKKNQTQADNVKTQAAEIKGGKRSSRDVLLKSLICLIISGKNKHQYKEGCFMMISGSTH